MKTKKCKEIFKAYPELKFEWKEIFKERSKKVGKRKAIFSADAIILAEALKIFTKPKEKKYKKFLVEEKKVYPTYKKNNIEVILTKDKSILKDYPKAKLVLEAMDISYDIQIISEIVKAYSLKIDKSFYYVIIEKDKWNDKGDL